MTSDVFYILCLLSRNSYVIYFIFCSWFLGLSQERQKGYWGVCVCVCGGGGGEGVQNALFSRTRLLSYDSGHILNMIHFDTSVLHGPTMLPLRRKFME